MIFFPGHVQSRHHDHHDNIDNDEAKHAQANEQCRSLLGAGSRSKGTAARTWGRGQAASSSTRQERRSTRVTAHNFLFLFGCCAIAAVAAQHVDECCCSVSISVLYLLLLQNLSAWLVSCARVWPASCCLAWACHDKSNDS